MRPPLLPTLFLTFAITAHMFTLQAQQHNTLDNAPLVTLSKALQNVRTDLEHVKKQVIETRQRISLERAQKQAELTELDAEIVRLRHEISERSQDAHASVEVLKKLREDARSLEQCRKSAWSVLLEARRNAETHFLLTDADVYASKLEQSDDLLDRQDEPSLLPECTRHVLGLIADHVDASSRIRTFNGRAVDDDGKEHNGVFIQFGGVTALFASSDSPAIAGLVCFKHGSVRPHVRPLKKSEDLLALNAFFNGQKVSLPLDVSGGNALRAMQAERLLSEEVQAGGVVMIPLLAVAIVCMGLGLWKALELWGIPVTLDAQILAFALALPIDRDSAARHAEALKGPMRRLMEKAIAYADTPRERLEEILHDEILTELPALESRLGALSVGAAIAPLLGLLGTVTGMIHTFRMINVFGTGDARMLSGGISEALITTEVGLIIAIPILLFHALLQKRARRHADTLEKAALIILDKQYAEPTANGRVDK